MTNELKRPSWYDDKFYNKIRTPEEWLFELCKRYQFKQDEIGLPYSIYTYSIKQQEQCFIEFIFDQQIEKFLSVLVQAKPPQSISYPSVSDIFIMYHLLIKTGWYKNNQNRDAFESAISKITNEGVLSREEMRAFHEMYNIPWCIFYENHQQDNWCPKREMEFLSGIPISLNLGSSKQDTIKILKRKLNAWVGKLQGIQFQFDRWQESKILAVFDLTLWFQIQKKELTKIGTHKLIWPNGRVSNSTGEEVNPYDDIDHSIELVNRVIDKSPICSLLSMCEARKFKKENTSL
ncbi:TPA: hypothetical protein JBE90_12110 [Legionella pneumophila]|uniref:hypothetical protein n=1 Tax=Legionella pneumophila TaxID=446 RepID=UPI000770A066|nr:hypothetical protein [Legionella pneumophila]TIG84345.1 hypothetical protein DI110_09250 [Legionella pneumophila]CZG74386.1 Uncharacterised protein [Legionella pneumophila]STX82733.1 Uncharacterised protein [Legionella pneumophila]HAT8772822.1 hypothetical protein [Legionella pneumophila]HAU0153756.1 hypothetical protein [Legionella pneumophila]